MLWNHRKRKKSEERAEDGNGLTVGQRFDVGETFQDLARGPKGSPFNMLTLALAGADASFSSGTAKRGNTAGACVSAVSAQLSGIGGFLAGRAAGAAIGTSILPGVGTYIGAVFGGGAGAMFGDKIARTETQRAVNLMTASRPRVRFGGNFKDSQPAYTMRAKAEQELSGSLLNARRYLGREAQLFHQ
jgi:hypothetical protein